MKSRKLNLGCGSRFHPDWVNVNFVSTGESVIAANLLDGVPFGNDEFDVVYHSHLLEHFTKDDAPRFMSECYRVLKTEGVIRVAVPDLEAIVRNYLIALDNAKEGKPGWLANYEWILLEMYDQVTRNKSGGEMAKYLFREQIPNEAYIVGRCGVEANKLIQMGMSRRHDMQHNSSRPSIKLKSISSNKLKEFLLKKFLGKAYKALQIGLFRLGGENHQWMYDSYSLGKLLEDIGFKNVTVMSALESHIPHWTNFNLDTEPDGTVYKPDSLFIEAFK